MAEPLATASGFSVRVGGKALCSTGNSAALDPCRGNQPKPWEGRERAAWRIAMAWNLSRHLTDAELIAAVCDRQKKEAR